MDIQFEFERFRVEMNLQTQRLREDLDTARGELLAANTALHAVIALHPDRHRLGVALWGFETKALKRLEGASPRYQGTFHAAIAAFQAEMMDAGASGAG